MSRTISRMAGKIRKLFSDPVGVVMRRWRQFREHVRFRRGEDYRTEDFWRYRHETYGFDLRGVGDKSKTHEENVRLLEEGSLVFRAVCRRAGVRFSACNVLDVGCGTGHFAGVLREEGVRAYEGVDIVDTLFDGLRSRFPGFLFTTLDFSTQPLVQNYQLIIAMDVLQHISDEPKFAFAMRNIRDHLLPDGTLIVSTYLGPPRRDAFYVVRRPMERFKTALPGFVFSEPLAYADSHVFSARRPAGIE